jgi:hypothetical protein
MTPEVAAVLSCRIPRGVLVKVKRVGNAAAPPRTRLRDGGVGHCRVWDDFSKYLFITKADDNKHPGYLRINRG